MHILVFKNFWEHLYTKSSIVCLPFHKMLFQQTLNLQYDSSDELLDNYLPLGLFVFSLLGTTLRFIMKRGDSYFNCLNVKYNSF